DWCEVEDYKAGPIPLRVLQVVAHARPLFDEVHVWYSGSVQVKDPILVGYRGGNRYKGTKFILARWGDELGSLEELRERVVRLWKDRESKKARAKIAACEAFLAGGAAAEAERYFDGQFVNAPG
ncbi:MAG: hypothetical protein V3W32_08690, partial [Gemmatimonadota bacterium]